MTANLQLGDDLLRNAARLNRWATRHARMEVPFAQARLLALLEELGPARIGELARADHTSQPTLTTCVQRLEAAGWALRHADPEDARASLVSLTPAGRDALADVRRARAAVLQPVLDELGRRDPAALARVQAAVAVVAELLDASAPLRPVPTGAGTKH
ncbi:MAG TPA: MarR family transcriptional regulator [Propionicimonas sp.]|jgi:DNA-binding MarR family transcriptional regulator|uniref:MarR family winged helix-turn-helix transcriptional regulator n=1 Tax=Propionicimonas sp. TaxID=1955623 RepID=UPI002F422A41